MSSIPGAGPHRSATAVMMPMRPGGVGSIASLVVTVFRI